MRQCGDCPEWDVYVNFNHAGTTTMGQGPIGLQSVGYEANGEGTTAVVSFTSRAQFQDLDGVWNKWGPDVKTVVGLPCGDAYRTTTCMTARYVDQSVWTVTEAGRTASRTAGPDRWAAGRAAAGTWNGVDQVALRRCMDQRQDAGCLDLVPGLRACVRARLVCYRADTSADRPGRPRRAMTAGEAETKATDLLAQLTGTDHDAPHLIRAVAVEPSKAGALQRAPFGARGRPPADRDTWVVTVRTEGRPVQLPGVDHIHTEIYHATFDATDHELLGVCGGAGCRTRR